MKIAIASDHAGFELKAELIEFVKSLGYEIKDLGPYSNESVDYPDYAHPLARAIERAEVDRGIAICGSGNGISMALNKHQGIRAALCWNTEIVSLARQHNNANVCSLPARFISTEDAKEMIKVYLNTGFEGGRHQKRVDKIACS